MKTTALILIASASFAIAQTRTVTVNGNDALVSPSPQAFANANDLPLLAGNNTFSAANSFSGGMKSGDLHQVEAVDEIFTITVNDSAQDLYYNGVQLYTDYGNGLYVLDDGNGSYYWSDWWGSIGWQGPWATAEEGAALLRSFLPSMQPYYATGGSGSECVVTVTSRDLQDWSTSNGDLIPITINQQGRNAGWAGTGVVLSGNGDLTLSGTITSLSSPPSPPLLVTDSEVATSVTENWNAQGFAMSGQSYPLIGMWTSPGQQSMAIGFGGHPASNGDNLGARPWSAVNSSYVGRITYLGSEGNLGIDTCPASTWQTSNWSLARGWSFLYAGSVVAGSSTPGGFSTRLLVFDGAESASQNPGAYFWSNHSAVMWNADIGTNKREIRLKFFGAPSSGGYGSRSELATRVIASTEWTASRWRGVGTSDPASPQDGDLFFRSDTAKVKIYASGAWRDLN